MMGDTRFRDLFTPEEYAKLVKRRQAMIEAGAAHGQKYWKRLLKMARQQRERRNRERVKDV